MFHAVSIQEACALTSLFRPVVTAYLYIPQKPTIGHGFLLLINEVHVHARSYFYT